MSDNGFNTTNGIFLGAGLGAAAALSQQQRIQNDLIWHSMTPAQQASYRAQVEAERKAPMGWLVDFFWVLVFAVLTLFVVMAGATVYEMILRVAG